MRLTNNHTSERHLRPSLHFVQAINFELTYRCNMSCSHCLQQEFRKINSRKWLSTELAKKAIKDAHHAGITSTGINFTGGEVFLPESNLPDLVETAQSLHVEVRINTNGWWGDQKNIRVGSRIFPSAKHIVSWLRDMDIAALALSFDRRYEKASHLWHSVVSIIRECETQGQPYQVICTGVKPEEIIEGWYRLTEDEGINPQYLIPVEMEMIDIGGAAEQTQGSLQLETLAKAVRKTTCRGKGFFRPACLHICPDGGVRTCLYSSGAGWLGNIYQKSLIQIIKEFPENCVVEAFSSNDYDFLIETFMEPHAHTYRSTRHPCAISAILSRVVEKYDLFEREQGRKPKHEEQRLIHEQVARELNLLIEMEYSTTQ
jgi:MoaA/NifB/PqqE/SkfB family radical SAM enzyme